MFGEMAWKGKWCSIALLYVIIASHFVLHAECSLKDVFNRLSPSSSGNGGTSSPVKLIITNDSVVLANGLVNINLDNPTGSVNGIRYKGIKNILEVGYKEGRRGYWDIVWSRSGEGKSNIFDTLEGTTFKVIDQNDNRVEISFSKTWNPLTDPHGLPLNYDKRYIMLRGSSGFYSYAIFEQLAGWPALHMEEARITFKLEPKVFNYMAIADDKQRTMPNHRDFESGQRLAYGEAKLLINPEDHSLKGQVDDKYQYSMDNKDSLVHGWVSSRSNKTGFWIITPSNEFRSGGPTKADLTSHSGPTALSIFFSGHYAGPDMGIDTENGEPWKKVYGPVFIYLNSDSNKDPRTLWNDAKRQMAEETKKWPYDFPLSPDLLRSNQRGTVTGRFMVNDRYISKGNSPAKSAYIGLAPPGEPGSWQTDSKGYQFWTTTNGDGSFSISNIRPGTYNVYGWVPGVIGDYKYEKIIEIKSGSMNGLGDLVYTPPRNGPTIWEIGISDRTAAEFYIPDPPPGFKYTNLTEKYRQYGIWDRYTDLYPKDDLVYTVGKSDYRKDWFYAHVNRKVGQTYVPTTWQIKFPLANLRGTYTLRIALASATYAELQVFINDPDTKYPIFKTSRFIGRDNAIARHGIHGLYWLYQADIPASSLVNGVNTLYFKQTVGGSFNGVMYDYIRLEGPA